MSSPSGSDRAGRGRAGGSGPAPRRSASRRGSRTPRPIRSSRRPPAPCPAGGEGGRLCQHLPPTTQGGEQGEAGNENGSDCHRGEYTGRRTYVRSTGDSFQGAPRASLRPALRASARELRQRRSDRLDDGRPGPTPPAPTRPTSRSSRTGRSALAEGDVEAAADYFAHPEHRRERTAADQDRLPRRRDRLQPLAALRADRDLGPTAGDFTTATFELMDRPGGDCGAGVGGTASTSFQIEDGKIVEWRRVDDAAPAGDQGGGTEV